MSIEIIIVLTIGFFAIISISFGIINLMKFSFTSNRIAALEEAIEKKTKEFDLLKKERQSSVSQPYSKSSDKFEPPHDSARPSSIEGQSGPQIEIVRSYPTGFQTVEVEGMTTPEVLDVVDKNSPG